MVEKGYVSLQLKHRNVVLVAVLLGVGFVSMVALTLNIEAFRLPLTLLLFPGGTLAAFMTKSQTNDLGPPLFVLAANSSIYSVIAYLLISRSSLYGVKALKGHSRLLAIPTLIVAGLACYRPLDPLWPRHMQALANRQAQLQAQLPLGLGISQADKILRQQGIVFQQESEIAATLILDDGRGKRVSAAQGETVISSRVKTEARTLVCGYDLQVVLLFDRGGIMKGRYVEPLALCP